MPACRPIAVFALAALLLAQSWSARPPRVVSRSEPEYSEEARRASVNTTIVVSLVVNENGVPQDIKVVQGAGFGLDEMAIRAIETWRFEPGTKEGKPFAAAVHVEVGFRQLDGTRAGQTARLNFNLPPDVERPELIKGKIPSNPDPPGHATLRIRFTVGSDGRPKNFQTFDTDNLEWTDRAVHEMAGWRFRPATRASQPEEVNGIFELTVSQPHAPNAPENHPSLRRGLAPISPPVPQDSSLPSPKPISPPDRATFDAYPRHLTCRWGASPGAVSYLLEWDYMAGDAWHAESQGIPGTAHEVTATETTFDFVGAQPGRWRVWPVNGNGQRGNPSEWRTFRFLR
ncbi:MAG TPA: energy transducer TonB [Bryobacteraceae bacterium]|jgi:TonB family protein|nr:energy transducer TonB [Bryobacteraceae bacterium]